MIAILLYLIGLISVIVTVVIVGYDAPAIYQSVLAAYNAGLDQLLPALGRIAMGFGWALTPFLGGLLLMGFSRIMMLLGAIRHALKGPA
ncbi:MAG TPA: hypothetical protein VFE64_10340 [Devosia sp.]|jgi:glycosyltransferase A (GT-A) superfamily protein (DUF2064 family)|nr:hypothetical protein [Devosia sp.]